MTQHVSIRNSMLTLLVAGLSATSLVACDSSSKKSDGGTDRATTDGGAGDAPALTALQLRGKYLVDSVIACGDCHTPRTATGAPDMTKYLAGNAGFIELPTGDILPSRNLTNDATGLKNLTDDEIKGMFLNGIRPLSGGGAAGDASTGMKFLNPVMPYYVFHNMDDDDANAIVAYLRVVPGVENDIPKRSALFDVPAAAPPLNVAKIPAPLPTFPNQASAMRGKYLTSQIGLCVECHTKHNAPGAPTILDEANLFAGGEDFSAFFAATLMLKPVSKNLTSDSVTGLGEWTTQDIIKVLKEAKAKDGSGICPPMPAGMMAAYGHLTDADAMDIANYIKSLPPKVNMIVDMCSFPPMAPDADGGSDAGAASDAASTADGGTGS